ncbi:acyltransferase [Acinetobacter qingfengensis]|uniref:Acyltransferase n=1 Tax=Acinetobacter qingfengensis TaxID=1262585 RepID=A0A1E7R2W4_9GAMM|nr:acyltransferase [Acinetobacter qingfengensis]KAA8733855.1 acyltransferase [Acinetobacter qingfengensis]OEY93632.1 acyltransferase [Acinetobacter qingfengensis]
MSQRWDGQQEKGSFLLLRLTLWLYRCLGRRIFMLILSVIIWWYWLFARQARQFSCEYLQHLHQYAGSQSPFPALPNEWHSYQHLKQFGMSILDKMTAWLGIIPEQELQLFGHEHLQQYYGKGAIILVSHFGNIELLRAVKSEHVQMVNVLVYRKHAEQFNAFLRSINPKAGVRLISVDDIGVDTALLLQQRLDAGEWIIVAADRIPINSQRQQNVCFLGQQSMWPEGAWLLAHVLNAPVLAVFCYRYQQQWQVHIHSISQNLQLSRHNRTGQLQNYMQQYVQLVEQHCLRAPYQWFNFYDFWQQTPVQNR